MIIFCLYALGFVIVNSFLGQFGIRAGSLFRFDYVAAALCYLIFLAAVGLPVWAITYGVERRVSGMPFSKWLWAILVVWNAVIVLFRGLFFPDSPVPQKLNWVDKALGCFVAVQIIITVVVWKRKKPTKLRSDTARSNMDRRVYSHSAR